MRVEFLERLQCPVAHVATPLITVAIARRGDDIVDGTLGCPICAARYRLAAGVAHLRHAPDLIPTDGAAASTAAVNDAIRIAALLNLQQPGARVALAGTFGGHAAALEDLTQAVTLSINARTSGSGILLALDAPWPLSDATFDGVALDASHAALLADVARVVRSGGRVLAPVHAPIPAGCEELARDAIHWVAQVTAGVSRPVPLQRSTVRV